jgi:dipeptidyl aminopeptidase/acylaminoacyl peptidase
LSGARLPLPAGLGGRLAFWQGDGESGRMSVSNLDGSQLIALGAGLFPALAPDAKKVVYRASDRGLHIRDLSGEADFVIPGTVLPDVYNNDPAWSPDGQQIAFSRFADDNSDLYLVNADGSNLHKIVSGPEQHSFLGWAADSRFLYYSTYAEEIHHIFTLELQSGETREMLALPPGTIMFNISPDGRRLVYGTGQGTFITGSASFAPRLLFQSALNLGEPLLWSPDGQWLALGYWGAKHETLTHLALLQPDTCQFVLLQETPGFFSSWVP